MTEQDMMMQLAAAIEKLARPTIPLSVDLWDMATIAQYLKRDPQVVRERMACLPSFPKAIRLPTKAGRSQPLYQAADVIAWARSYQERH